MATFWFREPLRPTSVRIITGASRLFADAQNYRQLSRSEQIVVAWCHFQIGDVNKALEEFESLYAANPDGCPGKRFPIALRGILASKGCVIRIALVFVALCLSVNAGELAGVITAQKSFVNAATELERHVGDFHSSEELATGMQEYLRAKKQLQNEIEKELPELKAQIAHRKLPTPEGLGLGLHLNDFPAERMQHLETILLTNLEKDTSQKTPANALAELNWLRERGTRIYKELM